MIDLDYRFNTNVVAYEVDAADCVATASAADAPGWDRAYARAGWLAGIDLGYDALFMPFRLAIGGCELFDDAVLRAACRTEPLRGTVGWIDWATVPVAVNGARALVMPGYHGHGGFDFNTLASPARGCASRRAGPTSR
jgi:hypothetical protein